MEMAVDEMREDMFFIRKNLKLDEEGDADHLAMKAFSNVNFFAQIDPHQYSIDPFCMTLFKCLFSVARIFRRFYHFYKQKGKKNFLI